MEHGAIEPQANQEQLPKGNGGGIKDIVVSVQKGLTQLQDILEKSGVVDDQDKAQLGSIVSGFEGFIESLGQAPGQSRQEAMPTIASPEAGVAKVTQAL